MARPMTIQEFHRKVEELGRQEFRTRLRRVLVRTALRMEAGAKKNASGTSPKPRTGRLRSSIRGWVAGEGGDLSVRLQAGGRDARGEVVYAQSQEFGGTVKARGRGMLRIPLAPALTGAGVDRFSGPIRELAPDAFAAFPSSSGRLFLWRVDEPGPPVPWYRLVRSITIPRTLFLGRAVDSARRDLPSDLAHLFRLSLETERGAAAET